MAHRSISLILSTFEGVLVPHKHSTMLRIKATFSLDFIHALILILGSIFLLARRSAVCEKKNGSISCSFPQNMKTQVV